MSEVYINITGGEPYLPVCENLPPRGTPQGDLCLSIGIPSK